MNDTDSTPGAVSWSRRRSAVMFVRGAVVAAILGLAYVPAAPPVTAGVDSEQDLTQLSLEELMRIEIPDVYAASQFHQKITDAPSAVTIVTSRDIELYGYRSLADILRATRGFYVSYDRNYGYVGVRGFSRPGDFNSRVLVMLDGHRLNDSVYDSWGMGSDDIVDVELIDHVEIVRGPGSSLYGSNALFAVINIVTKTGSDLDGTELLGRAASWGTAAGRMSYGRVGDNGVDMLLSASGYDSHGQRLYYPEFDDPATQGGWTDGTDGGRYGRLFGRLSAGNFTIEVARSSRTKAVPTGSYGTVFGDPRTETTDRTQFVDLAYGRDLGQRSRVDARSYLQQYKYTGEYIYQDGGPAVVNRDGAWGNTWGSEIRVATRRFARQVLVAGAEARINDRQDQVNYDEDPYESYVATSGDSSVYGVYVQDEIAPVTQCRINLGLRFDHYETFGDSLNPRVAVIYKPEDRTAVKLLYGRAFRAPNAYELDYADSYSTKASTGLRPETISTYELVLERDLAAGSRISGSLFRYRMDDLINLELDPADDLLVFRNVDQVTSTGLEVEMEKRWTGTTSARIAYTLQRAEDSNSGVELSNSPRQMAKLHVTTALLRERLRGGLELLYTSRRKTLTDGEAGGYAITNVTLQSFRFLPGVRMSASIYNLFDRRYADPGSAEHLQDVISQDGRSFRLQVAYRF